VKPALVLILLLAAATVILWPTAVAATSISFTATMEPNSNEFLAGEGWYIVKTFMFATDDKYLCSSSNCSYSIDNGQFRPNIFTHGFTFEGDIKISLPQGSAKSVTSKFYPMRIDFDKTGSVENMKGNESKQVDSLSGMVKLGSNILFPDFKYKTENVNLVLEKGNSTLANPVLNVKVLKCFFC
jgi:hypothetical protein